MCWKPVQKMRLRFGRYTAIGTSCLAVLLGIWVACEGGSRSPDRTLRFPEAAGESAFGWAIAVESGRVLIGAPHVEVDGKKGAGAAYLFDADSGRLVRAFANPEPAERSDFGYSVAISGSRLLVGAPSQPLGDLEKVGAAHLFDAETGERIHSWREREPGRGLEFGLSVALTDRWAFVSSVAPREDVAGAGAVYVYDTETGALLNVLSSPKAGSGRLFGYAMAVRGGRAVIGAPQAHAGGALSAGAAFLVDLADGALRASLRSPDPQHNAALGSSVAVSSSRIVLGAPGRLDAARRPPGSAQVFDAIEGRWLFALRPPGDPGEGRLFGLSVAVGSGRILVGAPADWRREKGAQGRVYLFDETDGRLVGSVSDPDPRRRLGFGIAVAQLAGTAFVGAPEPSRSPDHSIVYTYGRAEPVEGE